MQNINKQSHIAAPPKNRERKEGTLYYGEDNTTHISKVIFVG